MRGRKRKQSVKAEEEPKEETTDVQESQSTKIVPSFGKRKKVSNVKTKSAKTDVLEPSTQTTVEVHREESEPAGVPQQASSKENKNESTKAFHGTNDIEGESNPGISSDAKGLNDQGIENSSNESKRHGGTEKEAMIVPENDAAKIQAVLKTKEREIVQIPSSSQTSVPVRNIRSLQFDPSGDAKPYAIITKDTQNRTEIFDENNMLTSKEDTNEQPQKSVVNSTTTSTELQKNANENADVAVFIKTAPTKFDIPDEIGAIVTNTAPTNDHSTNENAVATNTAQTKVDGADENAVKTNAAPTKYHADQSDASPTLRDLSYDEESQESVVEIHKLLDYHFENFPKLADTKPPLFGFTNDCADASSGFIQNRIVQNKILESDESSNSHITDDKCLDVGKESTKETAADTTAELQKPNELKKGKVQCSKDRPCQTASALPTTPESFLPPTQGFGIHGIDFPIAATQNFNISYSPLMSISPDSSNPDSPSSFPDKDAPMGPTLCSHSVQETHETLLNVKSNIGLESQSNITLQNQENAVNPKIESVNRSSLDGMDNVRQPSRNDEIKTDTTRNSATPDEQRFSDKQEMPLSESSSETKLQMSFPIRPSTSKNDMLKQVYLVQNKDHSSVDNSFEDEVINMEDDFGVSDSQMCAIDYEEPMAMDYSCQQKSLPHRATPPSGATTLQGATPLPGPSTSHVSRPDQEGHNIMQGLIKDISGLNKMLMKTKREMEAFRRNRGFTPLQNRNWQQ
ncbi:hypothetical protein LOTGIDRAFT_230029 [Lottia gigantea]|uniref:Uncharacterized protein n=1 Tax=Lottia gigantea TaxID=225164 RepID=V4AL98_LOTGI|nr:hypothetical protein LOTGIDRAFT_230029 [Lottia gigantea]ESP04974.1 hypothetical protein LOTGIDRAFT_230029 [Lottia gigantea]